MRILVPIIFLTFLMMVTSISAFELLQIPAVTIGADGQGVVEVTITNANEYAPWDLYTNCTEGFYQKGSFYREIGNHTISIPIVCSGIIKGTCDVIVTDVNNPSYKDSIIVNMECLQRDPPICTPGETRCNGNLIEICTGPGWEMNEICENDCVNINFEATCKEDESGIDIVYLMSIVVVMIIVLLVVILVVKRKHLK